MRSLSTLEQEDRKKRLLQAVIHHYVKTGKPVGSALLAEEDRLEISPATIRHCLAELEMEGYLSHPHTSAGRVPTDKAYRFYVDSLVEVQQLALAEEERIRKEYEARRREIEEFLAGTSKTLSVLSRYTGFVLAPTLEKNRLQRVELVPLEDSRWLAILVSDTGQVKHRLLDFGHPLSAEMMGEISRLLNARLRGKPFSEARDTFLHQLDSLIQQQIDLMDLARQVAEEAFCLDTAGDLFVEGAANILSLPDFQSQEQMRAVVHLLDEKRVLGDLLAQDIAEAVRSSQGQGVRVRIGQETGPAFRDISLISSTYTIHGQPVGVLGILGPKRMEYSRVMGLVDYISKAVSRFLHDASRGGER